MLVLTSYKHHTKVQRTLRNKLEFALLTKCSLNNKGRDIYSKVMENYVLAKVQDGTNANEKSNFKEKSLEVIE